MLQAHLYLSAWRILSGRLGGSVGATLTKIQSLDQLLDVAGRLFGELGYEATRLEDIAEELGVFKGSLYHYIDSKADLHFLVTRRRLLAQRDKVQAIADSDITPREKLEQSIRAHLLQFEEFFPESAEWFARPYERSTDETQARVDLSRGYEHLFRRIVQQGVDEGIFRPDVDVSVASLGILGMCNWTTRWYVKNGRLSIEQISDTIVGIALDGLSPRAGDAVSRFVVKRESSRRRKPPRNLEPKGQ